MAGFFNQTVVDVSGKRLAKPIEHNINWRVPRYRLRCLTTDEYRCRLV